MLICGPSGAGKTILLTNILLNIQYNKIYLYAKYLEQPKYQYLRDSLEEEEEVSREVGYDVIDAVIMKLLHSMNFLCQKQNRLIDYFFRGRNKNCSVIYLSQSFFKTPKDIRLNCSHVYLLMLKM